MVDDVVPQTAGQQALARLAPVQGDQLAKARRLLAVVDEGRFLQLHLPRFAVEQADAAEGELLFADVQVRQADRAVDDPVGLMAGGHDAQLVRRALVGRPLATKGAGAIGDVA